MYHTLLPFRLTIAVRHIRTQWINLSIRIVFFQFLKIIVFFFRILLARKEKRMAQDALQHLFEHNNWRMIRWHMPKINQIALWIWFFHIFLLLEFIYGQC